ncbi:MAG: FG-GAP repeat protein [Acidobacteria bacterium]|nr:FG-GAP repeat protein [Acidobacteriota bacterium]
MIEVRSDTRFPTPGLRGACLLYVAALLVRAGSLETDEVVTMAKIRLWRFSRQFAIGATVVLLVGGVAVPPGFADFSAPTVLAPPASQPGFGFGLAAGDINGDGKADVIAGSTQSRVNNLNNAGKVFVYPGGTPKVTAAIELQAPTPESEARFGWNIKTGDVNGDTYDDIIVSAIFAGGGTNGKGGAYVFFGAQNFAQKPADLTLELPPGLNNGARYGWSVAVGSIDGDNIDDLVVAGENVTVNNQPQAGQVYIYRGSPNFTGALSQTLQSPAPQRSGSFGNDVAVGDVDHNGFGDVIVGSPGVRVMNFDSSGQTFIFSGGSMVATTPMATLSMDSPKAFDRFGFSVASADVDGDSFADVFVGASQPGSPPFGAPGPGNVKFFRGGSPFDSMVDGTIAQTPPRNGVGFGQVLATGDTNRDGRADLLIGVPLMQVDNRNAAGELDLVLGGTPFDTAIDQVLRAPTPAASAELGLAVAVADVDGDLRGDLIAGMPFPPGFGGGGGGAGVVLVYTSQLAGSPGP